MDPQIIRLQDDASGSTAQILVSLGFNCFSWQAVINGARRDLLWAEDGFERGDKRPSGSGIPLLFPFPGRIRGAQFHFAGRDYQLEPGDPFGNAIHGFVYNRPWRVVEQSGRHVVGEFQAAIDDPTILERWPADFRIRVSYELSGTALISTVRYENSGEAPLPCGFATHAYFRLPLAEGSDPADTIITVPVCSIWQLEQMIPTGEKKPIPTEWKLSEGMRLGEHRFDTVFSDIQPGGDGVVRTKLVDPASNRTLTQTFDPSFTQCVVYTPPHREAICLEPYSCVPDAIRLASEGYETGLQILQPAENREMTLRIEVQEG